MEDRGVWGYNFVKNVDHFFRKIYPLTTGGMGGYIFRATGVMLEVSTYQLELNIIVVSLSLTTFGSLKESSNLYYCGDSKDTSEH